jgi:tRNA threonylcarbamoyladenosine biosynthesis protein TsaE
MQSMVMIQYLSRSEEETRSFGLAFGKQLESNHIVCFFGDLGAGKTTFIKGLVEGAGVFPKENVNSPTFVYLNIYKGLKTVYHFDLYRLQNADEFLSMGFDEFFSANGICCIEWSERITPILPSSCIHVTMTHRGEFTRSIKLDFV